MEFVFSKKKSNIKVLSWYFQNTNSIKNIKLVFSNFFFFKDWFTTRIVLFCLVSVICNLVYVVTVIIALLNIHPPSLSPIWLSFILETLIMFGYEIIWGKIQGKKLERKSWARKKRNEYKKINYLYSFNLFFLFEMKI